MLKLFLSRDRLGDDLSALVDQRVVVVEHQSCIRLSLTTDRQPPPADWLFFLSPSGVELFARRFSTKGFRVGVIWDGTAEAVVDHLGVEPDFVATHGDSGLAVKEFVGQLMPEDTVTVAQGSRSLRRLRDHLSEDRLNEWLFYTNEPNPPARASDADYLLFTSPSNAEAYLSKHPKTAGQKIVAIGRTTMGKLQVLGHGDALLSEEPSEKGMWEAVVKDLKKLKSKG